MTHSLQEYHTFQAAKVSDLANALQKDTEIELSGVTEKVNLKSSLEDLLSRHAKAADRLVIENKMHALLQAYLQQCGISKETGIISTRYGALVSSSGMEPDVPYLAFFWNISSEDPFAQKYIPPTEEELNDDDFMEQALAQATVDDMETLLYESWIEQIDSAFRGGYSFFHFFHLVFQKPSN
jgi:hypothetical protein